MNVSLILEAGQLIWEFQESCGYSVAISAWHEESVFCFSQGRGVSSLSGCSCRDFQPRWKEHVLAEPRGWSLAEAEGFVLDLGFVLFKNLSYASVEEGDIL